MNLTNAESVPSPGLLVDPDAVRRNIAKMIEIAGDVSRLRPHVKTHKISEVVRLQIDAGIEQFKAATLAEVQVCAEAGAKDVLLAYQPVGPNVDRLAKLVARFPETRFSAICDCSNVVSQISDRLKGPFPLFIDIDCGMHRTGIPFGPEMEALRDQIVADPNLEFAGLHVYDGHVHDSDLQARKRVTGEIIATVLQQTAPTVIGGGSPTFGIWAQETDFQCSPGTTVFWDAGYSRAFPDLDFEIAAALLTRVISKPRANQLCLDLGHKSVAAENPLERRVFFDALPDAKPVMQSEEHLVIETAKSGEFSVGDWLIGVSQHVCPTVALHSKAHLIENGEPTGETWAVTARDR